MISFVTSHARRPESLLRLLGCVRDFGGEAELCVCDYDGILPADSMVKVCQESEPFSRSVGLNRAAALATGDVVFYIDVDMIFDREFPGVILSSVGKKRCYFPIPYSLNKGKPAVILYDGQKNPCCNGWWRASAYGHVGFLREDLLLWNEGFRHWGGEDNNMHKRCRDAGYEIVRERCPHLIHTYHDHFIW